MFWGNPHSLFKKLQDRWSYFTVWHTGCPVEYALCNKVVYREQGEKGKESKLTAKWISQKRKKLATKGTAACQGPYLKLQVGALALVWAAFLGACKDFPFKGNKAVVSNAVRWGFHFSALPQSQYETVNLKLITEEESGMDGTAQGVCPGTVDELWPASPVPDIRAMCVGISVWRSLLQTVAYVSSIVHWCPYQQADSLASTSLVMR